MKAWSFALQHNMLYKNCREESSKMRYTVYKSDPPNGVPKFELTTFAQKKFGLLGAGRELARGLQTLIWKEKSCDYPKSDLGGGILLYGVSFNIIFF